MTLIYDRIKLFRCYLISLLLLTTAKHKYCRATIDEIDTNKKKSQCENKDEQQERFVIQTSNKIQLSTFPKKSLTVNDENQEIYIINDEKSLYYITNFLSEKTMHELINICESQNRFQKSPQKDNSASQSLFSSEVFDDDRRTSESCPMVPSSLYLSNPKYIEMISSSTNVPQHIQQLKLEVDLSWGISQKVAKILSSEISSFPVLPEHIEPLQIVKYKKDAYYSTHHDHGAYYSNFKTEQRPFTILVYLNSLQNNGSDSGGGTSFPKLGFKFLPQKGDAILWSNVSSEGEVDPDMVHAGEPPLNENDVKYALNIWIGKSSDLPSSSWGSSKKN